MLLFDMRETNHQCENMRKYILDFKTKIHTEIESLGTQMATS